MVVVLAESFSPQGYSQTIGWENCVPLDAKRKTQSKTHGMYLSRTVGHGEIRDVGADIRLCTRSDNGC